MGITELYRNDHGLFAQVTDVDAQGGGTADQFPGLTNGAAAFGDIDNDGDVDLLLTGSEASGSAVSQLYRNHAGSFSLVEDVDIASGANDDQLLGVSSGLIRFGDVDNDGDLDLLLTGRKEDYALESRLYRNEAGNFSWVRDINTAIAGEDSFARLTQGTALFSDVENDGDLDLLLTGFGGRGVTESNFTELYENRVGEFAIVTDVDTRSGAISAFRRAILGGMLPLVT